ncbi:MAG: hypothetical protein ACXVH2_00845 [Methanobacterium sp.]
MTNFFTTSTGESIEQTDSFENSVIQKLIPSGTQLHASVLEATWEPETNYANEHVLIRWYITEKGEYNGFTVKQKLHVLDDEAKKADKAKTQLMVIDTNAKGELNKLANTGKFEVGNNLQLSRALNGANALLTLDVYDMPSNNGGDNMTGNWVRKIAPASKAQQKEDKHIERQAQQKAPVPAGDDEYEDSIPF